MLVTEERLHMRHMRHFSEGGFTIVELTVVMVIIAMVVGVFSQMLISVNQSASISRARVDINRNLHNAMDAIETDVRQTLRFKVSAHDGYDTFASRSRFEYREGKKNNLILLQYATSISSGSDSREIVYLKTPGFDCMTNKIHQPKYKKIVVYSIWESSGELVRRVYYNDLVDAHGNPYTGTPANYFCANAADAGMFAWYARGSVYSVLATDVSEFKVDYYEGDTLLTGQDNPHSSPKNLLDAADSVKVTLKIKSKDGRISDSQTLMIRKTNNL